MKAKLENWEKRLLFLLLTLLAIAVAFNLNGSSIGMWNRYVPNSRAFPSRPGDVDPARKERAGGAEATSDARQATGDASHVACRPCACRLSHVACPT